MAVTKAVRALLDNFSSDNPGTKAALARIFMAGQTGGTGKILVLAADHGFSHGAALSFADYPNTYDPHNLFELAVSNGLSAVAAPLGVLESGAGKFAGDIPLILKLNSGNNLSSDKLGPTQAVTAGISDALRLGCPAVGFTIYPGSDRSLEMFEDFAELAQEAKSNGLAVVVWAAPRGGFLSRDGENALDTVSYAAHMAANLGAHIINLRLPSPHIEQPKVKKLYKDIEIDLSDMEARIGHVVQAAFDGRCAVVFSGDGKTEAGMVAEQARAVAHAGGRGMFLGRNLFQREAPETKELVDDIARIFTEHKNG